MTQDNKTEKIPGSLDELTEQPAGEKFNVHKGEITYDLVKGFCIIDNAATLKWDAGRKEWIAETYQCYFEGYTSTESLDIKSNGGPYSLSDSACRILIKAYRISEDIINPKSAARMSPSELEIISLMNAKGSVMNAAGDKNV